jgi:4-hydroxy-tetrahydrodipicolinate synthase
MPSRREFLGALSAAALPLRAASKPMRGVFVIMATPYTEAKAVDLEDLAREVDFLDRCGVHGMVWPQLASEYWLLSKDERMAGMEAIAKAARGRKPALVFGVQGPNTEAALEYARHAEKLAPDAMIAIPPTEARTLDDYRAYYRALAKTTSRPFFIQTTGGAKGLTPEIDFLVEMAREFPHFGYIKEEARPVIERMQSLARHRPAIKSIFSGAGGRGMLYEARLGFDGTMPGAVYSDIHAQIWDQWHAGRREAARDLFARLLLMVECEQQVPGTRLYLMRKRGVFKTTVSRNRSPEWSPQAVAEMEFHFAALKPYLRA